MTDLSWEDVLAGEADAAVAPDQLARDADLLIVDGNNLAYRAFFAMPEELATKAGQPTGAISGFANLLAKVVIEYRPPVVVCCWDSPSRHRLELDPEYKANRQGTPDLLRQQFPYFPAIASAFGGLNVQVDGYEADDLIATVARRAEQLALRSCIVSNDRDAYQLVSPLICVLAAGRSFSDLHVYDEMRVLEKVGVTPSQYPCYLGLKGDPGDNIRGVPGFGEKTAAELIAQYGTLENLIDHADELKGKRRERLVEHADEATLAKELATMLDDVPIALDLELLETRTVDTQALAETLERFELQALAVRVRRQAEALVPEREFPVPPAIAGRTQHDPSTSCLGDCAIVEMDAAGASIEVASASVEATEAC